MLKKNLKNTTFNLDFGEFLNEISKFRKIGLICHHNADPDSLLSAYVLKNILKTKGIESKVYAPSDISEIARRAAIKIYGKLDVVSGIMDIEDNDALCLVDVSTLDQTSKELKEIIRSKYEGKLFIIDHHAPHPEITKIARYSLIAPNACSTGELIYLLAKATGISLAKEDLEAIAVAILYDTRRFIITDKEVFKIMSEIYDEVDYSSLLNLFQKEIKIDERIAKLKAATRLKLYKVELKEPLLVVISHVSSYEASAARALIELGADLAIVAGGKKGLVRICARCTKRFLETTGLHLGKDIMMDLGREISGSGGGHASAASANGIGTPEEALTKAINILRMKIGGNLKEIGCER